MRPSVNSIRAAGVLSFVLVAVVGLAQPVEAGTAALGGTTQWVIATPPITATIGASTFVEATYLSNFNATVVGVGILVLRNTANQSVFYVAGTATAALGQNGTFYFDLTGAPSGTFQGTMFVMAISGVAISSSTTASVTT